MRYTAWLEAQGIAPDVARQRANDEAEPWLRVGEVVAVGDLPVHQRADAEAGRGAPVVGAPAPERSAPKT